MDLITLLRKFHDGCDMSLKIIANNYSANKINNGYRQGQGLAPDMKETQQNTFDVEANLYSAAPLQRRSENRFLIKIKVA